MRKGFTLIELLVVMAIIAILMALAIPQYNKYRANAMLSNVQNYAKSVAKHATALATTAYQNPACVNATTITISYDSTNKVLQAKSGSTVCDEVKLDPPSWVDTLDVTANVTAYGTEVNATGYVTVKSTYSIGNSKYLGCKYDLANETLENAGGSYYCNVRGQ